MEVETLAKWLRHFAHDLTEDGTLTEVQRDELYEIANHILKLKVVPA